MFTPNDDQWQLCDKEFKQHRYDMWNVFMSFRIKILIYYQVRLLLHVHVII